MERLRGRSFFSPIHSKEMVKFPITMVSLFIRAWLRSPAHVILFSIYPVLALFLANIQEIDPNVIWRPMVIGIILAVLLYLLSQTFFKNYIKSAILVTLSLILFFSYGHVFDLIRSIGGIFLEIGRNRYLIPLWIALWGGSLVFILRKPAGSLMGLNRYLNLISIILLLLILAGIIQFSIQQSSTSRTIEQFAIEVPKINQAAAVKPDIYYIILDSYPREDVLLNENGIDNSEFIRELQEIGFVIPPCSRSNYNYTLASVASSLNMNYLDQLPVPMNTDRTNRLPMRELIYHSRAAQTLSQAGYQTVSVEHNYRFMEWEDADIFFKQPQSIFFDTRFRSFERILLRTTALRYLIDAQSDNINKWNRKNKLDPQLDKYYRELFTFDSIKGIPANPEPTLFFTNIDAIHAPLVFGADGSYVGVSDFQDVTLDQINERINPQLLPGSVEYLNKTLLELVKGIIRDSSTAPVIILQGDHAMSNSSRNLIFNAYYLPGNQTQIPAGITPVNTFRLIFNSYFDANLPLLSDRAYLSDYGKTPYQFKETRDKNPVCQ